MNKHTQHSSVPAAALAYGFAPGCSYVNRKERDVSNARWWISVHEKDLMKKLSNTRWMCWQYTSFQTPSKVDIKNLILFLLRAVCDDRVLLYRLCAGGRRKAERAHGLKGSVTVTTDALCTLTALDGQTTATVFMTAHPTHFAFVSLFVKSPYQTRAVPTKWRLDAARLCKRVNKTHLTVL